MHNANDLMELLQQDRNVGIKEFIHRIFTKWHWFALFGIFGLIGGYFMSKSTPATYKVTGSILVTDDSKGMDINNIFDGVDLGGKTNIDNHILTLKSYIMSHQAMTNLGWNVSFYKKGFLKDESLYGNVPFKVIPINNSQNITGIKINVKPISDNQFLLIINQEKETDEGLVSFDVREKLTFGQIYSDKYFNFYVEKTDNFKYKNTVDNSNFISNILSINNENNYYFYFNNISNLSKIYKNKTNISLATKAAKGIMLSLIDNNKQRAIDYLNELMRVYLAYGLNNKNRTSENTVRFIDGQLVQLVDSLNITGKNFTDFRSRNGIVNLSQEGGLIVEKLKELESEKAVAERSVEYFENLQDYMGNSDQVKLMVAPSVAGIADPGLNAQVLKLSELYSKRTNLSFVAKEKNPSLLMVEDEIKATLKSLEENLRNLLANAKLDLKSLNRRISMINIELAGLPKTEQELINIKRRFDLNNELYTFLLQKRAEAAITKASNVPDAQILDPACLDTTEQVGPRTQLNILFGIILGLAIPFIFILLWDYFDESIRSKEELEKYSKVRYFGSIAHNKYKSETPVIDNPRSGIAENFRGLRYKLHNMNKLNGSKIIAVHSMFPNEGKTFNALNLASIMALENKKVLLVGCDLRKPRLHKIFDHKNENGLSTFLVGHHQFHEIISSTLLKNLNYVNSGPIPHNPSELIGNGEFKDFINKAQESFDYIILDNAPVALVTDGMIIGTHAHVNMFVLRQDYSKKNQIKYINQIKEENSLKQIGIILNDSMYNGYGNSYGNYGYSYGNEYYNDKHINKGLKNRIFRGFSKS